MLPGVTPVGISECLMSMRVPLVKIRYVTLISCYAPTLTSSEDSKDQFYEELDNLLSDAPQNDKIIILGDFNAWDGSNYNVWHRTISRHGLGKENANGVRLLNLCALYNLTITNTLFQLPTKQKTTWMHTRSKHWHLIDYIITRQSDIQDLELQRLSGAQNAGLTTTSFALWCSLQSNHLTENRARRSSCEGVSCK